MFPSQVEQNWATLQGGEMTIQTTQASEATQAVASLAEAAVAASQEMQQGATVTMALNRYLERGQLAQPGPGISFLSVLLMVQSLLCALLREAFP